MKLELTKRKAAIKCCLQSFGEFSFLLYFDVFLLSPICLFPLPPPPEQFVWPNFMLIVQPINLFESIIECKEGGGRRASEKPPMPNHNGYNMAYC